VGPWAAAVARIALAPHPLASLTLVGGRCGEPARTPKVSSGLGARRLKGTFQSASDLLQPPPCAGNGGVSHPADRHRRAISRRRVRGLGPLPLDECGYPQHHSLMKRHRDASTI
jgi:hypothetical protein